jgi:hypothetical protein
MINRIGDFTPDKNTYHRLYEIAFYKLLERIKNTTGNENFDYYLENFSRVFSIDYTSLGIIKNMYFTRMTPTKRELALYGVITHTPLNHLKIDYRTLRKYRGQWLVSGTPQLQPHIVNEFLRPVIKMFVDSYLTLMYDDLNYIKTLRGFKLDDNGNG